METEFKLKIGILGTRGIPNNYGGFEQFAEYLSTGLIELGNDVYVYNSHDHPYQEKSWNNVIIIHKFDPSYKIGTFGQFIYDLLCTIDTRKRNFDIILQLGYTSSSVWNWLLPNKNTIVTTNMDGLEWKRDKYSKPVQKFLQFAEYLAVKMGGFLIADSIGIQNYLKNKYNIDSTYIPYGAELINEHDETVLTDYNLRPFGYDILIARLEPENNIETILKGISESGIERDFVVVGNYKTDYGNYIKNKFTNKKIKFLGAIYNKNVIDNLRYFSNIYFHGHTVGGTNPSLLEAMATSCLICANKNEFNFAILGEDAYYFENSEQVSSTCLKVNNKMMEADKINSNIEKVKNLYSYKKIINDYFEHFIYIKKLKKKLFAHKLST